MRKPNSILIIAVALASIAVPRAVPAPAAKWLFTREAGAYGLKLPGNLPAAVEGSLSFSVSAKDDADLTVSLTVLGAKEQVNDLASMRRYGDSWLVELGFPASGKYLIAISGKRSSSAAGGRVDLVSTTVEYKGAQGSAWTFSPAFARLGLMVEEAPSLEVGDSASILVAAPKELESSFLFTNAAGRYLNSGVSIVHEERGWRVEVAFPDSGAYQLSLYAKTASERDYTGVARVRFQSKTPPDPSSRLARAALFADLDGMRSALAAKADPNVQVRAYRYYTSEGKKFEFSGPPIFAALSRFDDLPKQLAVLKLLKAAGADFRARSSEGETIVVESFATAYLRKPEEELRLLKVLLELGADPMQPSDYAYTNDGKPTKAGLTSLLALENHCYQRESDFAPCIPVLIAGGANPRARWPWGATALEALFKDYEPRKKPLILAYLDAGVDPSPEELHALALAIVSKKLAGDFEFVDRVLAASKDINAPDDSDDTFLSELVGYFGTTALSAVDRRKLLDLAKARGGDFNYSSGNGETPLMAALSSGNLEGFDDLVARGADPKAKNARGRTLLFYLPKSKDLKTVLGLIDRLLALGLDINARDARGDTAFNNYVSAYTSVDFLKLLVSKGADPAIPDRDGYTAYGYAKSSELKEIADYLETLKIPVNIGGWPVGNKAPACRAVLEAELGAISTLPAAAFAEMVARTSDGALSTPLHLAAEAGNAKVIEALAARKVDWGATDYFGRRPLELAVLAGKAEAVGSLMAAGADPNAADENGGTPLSRAVAARSPLAKLMLDAGAKPDWSRIAFAAVISSTPEEARRLSGGSWGSADVDAMSDFGRTDLLAAFASSIRHDSKELPELVQRARDEIAFFEAYEKGAATPFEGKALPAEQKEKKGSYALTLDSWSPWMEGDPAIDLKKYPVAVYVPKEYNGSKPYGLIVSMMNAKGSSQFPKPEYLGSLSSRRLIYVGFDPYNGVYENASTADFASTNHERLVLAAVYRMLGAYSIDRRRIYLTGFSWGGRLTGEIVPKWPNLFSGGIAVCGCFITRQRLIPSYRYGRDRVTMVCATSDWDYNRAETHNGYDLLSALGYEAYYLQDPLKGHSRISGNSFEKALGFLDAAAARRAIAKKQN